MAAKNPYRPFTPDPDMLSLRPNITGNEINGLAETSVRQPSMVYWAPNPDDIPFGDVQKWFYQHEPQDAELMKERAKRKAILEAPLSELAKVARQRTPQKWTENQNTPMCDIDTVCSCGQKTEQAMR